MTASPRRTKARMDQLRRQLHALLEAEHPQSVRRAFFRMTDPGLPEPVARSFGGYIAGAAPVPCACGARGSFPATGSSRTPAVGGGTLVEDSPGTSGGDGLRLVRAARELLPGGERRDRLRRAWPMLVNVSLGPRPAARIRAGRPPEDITRFQRPGGPATARAGLAAPAPAKAAVVAGRGRGKGPGLSGAARPDMRNSGRPSWAAFSFRAPPCRAFAPPVEAGLLQISAVFTFSV